MYESSHPSQQGQSWQDAHLRRMESQKGSHGTHNVTREIRQDLLCLFCRKCTFTQCIRLNRSLSFVFCLSVFKATFFCPLIGCVFYRSLKVLEPLCMA